MKIEDSTVRLIEIALAEDVGSGDVTVEALVPKGHRSEARIIAKEELVVAGLEVAKEVFRRIDEAVKFEERISEGSVASKGDIVAEVSGPTRALLTGERVALNFLCRLSGIATATKRLVDRAGGRVRVLDTRKTAPGWRSLEKRAVALGGGVNHRMGLYDAYLIKENHIAVCGGIKKALEMVGRRNVRGLPVEIEVRNLEELKEALEAGAKYIMLDNFSLEDAREAVSMRPPGVILEASGGINEGNIAEWAKTGVDQVAVGWITHSAKAVDMTMLIDTG